MFCSNFMFVFGLKIGIKVANFQHIQGKIRIIHCHKQMFDYFLFLSEHIFGETHSSVAKYMNFSYLCNPVGFGGGMVDTRDLKSLGQECLYGFESRPKHKEGWQEHIDCHPFS